MLSEESPMASAVAEPQVESRLHQEVEVPAVHPEVNRQVAAQQVAVDKLPVRGDTCSTAKETN